MFGSFWTNVLVVLAVLLLLVRKFAPEIYDAMIVHMTELWYKSVLDRLPDNAKVLDIGIGTGSALARHAQLVQRKNLRWFGVDYNAQYVEKCGRVARESGLSERLQCIHASVYDNNLGQQLAKIDASSKSNDCRDFDAVYFSGSISLMPDPVAALHATAKLLKAGGKIYVTQTFQRRGAFMFSYIKPWLRYITTVDFGQLVFEYQFDDICKKSGFQVLEKALVPGSVDNAFQAAFIIVLKP